MFVLCLYFKNIIKLYFRTKTDELMNTQAGISLKAKPAEANEGGLSAGMACLDSLFYIL